MEDFLGKYSISIRFQFSEHFNPHALVAHKSADELVFDVSKIKESTFSQILLIGYYNEF